MRSQSGNMLFIILIAIALIGLLTAVITSTDDSDSANINNETLMIRASEVQRYASELERGVTFVMQNGHSESDIRFSSANAPSGYGTPSNDTYQIFAKTGGGATYRKPPADVNDGSGWEFYGGTAVPGVGSARADLVAVLPNVTKQFCAKIDTLNSQSAIPEDKGTAAASNVNAGGCVFMNNNAARFGDDAQFYDTPNTMDETTFAQDANTSSARTALQACVLCERDGKYHFYHVLMAR